MCRAVAVVEAKSVAWEEFGEAVESDFQSASKRFWGIWRLRRGRSGLAQAVLSRSDNLLTSNEDIVGRWKEYF